MRAQLTCLGATAAAIVLGLASLTVAPAAVAADSPKIVIDLSTSSQHKVVNSYGYDLKQSSKAEGFTAQAATTLFGASGEAGPFNSIRVPILAAAAHKPAGVENINDALYAPYIAAVKNIPNYNARVDVQASLILVDGSNNNEFPGWVKDANNQLLGGPYGKLLFEFVRYWDKKGITIDSIGPLNELNIPASKYVNIVESFKDKINTWNANNPIIRSSGPSSSHPTATTPSPTGSTP